ncbi:hypothetical protein BDP27DRAFT_1351787 [Rhodocollybia butyracea]|uniref:Uncharacterized protein n=1 Tax=Rhodocollybia butyracea TaxID=206335 RepID=A0A9P5P4S2_9AGAR|nr:hypothetical protein BDP27DRAFT_1351787 [Rhodocollybia butyracea]
MEGVRRSSRKAMVALAQRFPLLKDLKLSPDQVNVLDPLEVQLMHVGIIRHFSSSQDLQNIDPDFAVLERHFDQLQGLPRSQKPQSPGDVDESTPSALAANVRDSGMKATFKDRSGLSVPLEDLSSLSEDSADGGLAQLSSKGRRTGACSPLEDHSADDSDYRPTKTPRQGGRAGKNPREPPSQPPRLPSVTYQVSTTSTSSSNPAPPLFRPSGLDQVEGKPRQKKRKRQYNAHHKNKVHSRSIQVHVASEGLNISQDSRISKPGWMGVNASQDMRGQIAAALTKPPGFASAIFSGIKLIPYIPHFATAVCDRAKRMFLYRSQLTPNMLQNLLPKVHEAVPRFVAAIHHPFSEESMLRNSRGDHWFSIAGHDRNNKQKPEATQFQRANHETISEFFAPGQILHDLTRYGCSILKQHFPAIAERYTSALNYMKKEHGIEAQFGLFFNFCLNAAREGTKRVFCKPHVDWKNLAFGVCMIFVYGHFDHREKCWLVIWEAGIALELPPGAFLFYPSSLFLHFNIDLSHLPIVTTPNGERPTRENSKPLYFCGCKSHPKDGAWAQAEGRGSMVWFNQASMFQTSETGMNTLKDARVAGVSDVCNGGEWLEKSTFPYRT